MADVAGEAGKVFSDTARTLAPAAVGSQVALMSVVSIVTVLVFNLLRPQNKMIYEPKVKYHVGNKPPPRISDSIFGWLPPLFRTKEPELVDKIGLDAVTFLRFLRLMRWLFTAISLLACASLIPVNVTYNLKNVNPNSRDILSMLTIRDVSGTILFVHVAASYIMTIILIVFIDSHWKSMVKLRHDWFRSPEYLQSFYARTLAVLHVPKKYQSDDGIRSVFESVKVPYPTTSVHIGRKVGRLPELIEFHNATVREFEEILVKYLKGGKLGKNRPIMRLGGTCGCGGTRKDAIDYYTAKLKRTEAAIEEYRTQIETRKAENYGFASMAAVPYAHIVAKMLSTKHPKGADIVLAPNPKDIIWENMNKSDGELARKRTLGFWFLAMVSFFNTVPLFVISVLANLDALKVYVPFLESWSDDSPSSFAFVSGVLPPAVAGIFGFVLPIIMRRLTQYMGALTHSSLDRNVIARYFFFLVISQLVIFTLIGVIFNSVKEIIEQIGKKASINEILDNLHTLPDVIARTYINQASYWLTFFPLRGFLVVFDLAQIVNLVWISFKTHVFGRTPRDIREWTQPPEFQYAIYYSNILFMGAVGLVFAPLAPLVAVAAAIVLWMSSWVYKYQLMFVYVSKVETGGRLWNVVVNRLLFSALLMQALMVLTIGLQYQFKSLQWIATIPPILMILAFKVYINRTFLPHFNYYNPTEAELREAKIHSERADHKGNRLEKRFGHPALHTDLFTPMLHARMMPLLSQVYSGKVARDEAKLDEYGGQKMQAQVVEGIKIAAIEQRDLEYDPALYQRDRGELDWDARSISTTLYDGASTLQPNKSQYYASEASINKFPARDHYLTHGPGSINHSEIEMTTMEAPQEPLLNHGGYDYYQQQQGFASQHSLPPSAHSEFAPREAPLHRPQDRSYSPAPGYTIEAAAYQQGYPPQQQGYPPPMRSYTPQSQQQQQQQQQGYGHHQQQPSQGQSLDQFQQYQYHSRQPSNNNLAGQGAYRGY
ncbi:DUF221-domain-containing protein [Pluteus cervinus]|uniref:DUF221-domain-containing protein n=1 Tax=Pluteus cervinus TaxID=181527 RepID=A0ACD3B8W3_9AGAR|nr:DUF221-domain-containing protein [Pluteus cervinus]